MKKRGLAPWLRHREKRCPNRKGVFDLENFNKATSVPFENEEIDIIERCCLCGDLILSLSLYIYIGREFETSQGYIREVFEVVRRRFAN